MRQSMSILLLAMTLAVCATPAAAQAPGSFAGTSAATARVTEACFAAYVERDWERLAPLLADTGGLAGATAEPLFGKVEVSGKPATMRCFPDYCAATKQMQFNRTRAFFSGQRAVFKGTLDWTLALGDGKAAVALAMPFATILRLEGGLVAEHRDFADCQPFFAAHRRATGGA